MERIKEHPILGETPEGRMVTFTYDGQELQGVEGEPIAAALRVAGVMVHRYTKKRHEPRGVFCAIGRCTDCVMIVNGKPNIRTCITLEEGMVIQTQYGGGSIMNEVNDLGCDRRPAAERSEGAIPFEEGSIMNEVNESGEEGVS